MNNLLYTKLNNLFSKTKATHISSKTLYNGKFIKLISEKYKLPNNKIIDRERIEKNSNKESVIIIAITKENKFILVVQNRINELTSIEFPSGYIEEDESVEEAANRELQEEVGYISNDITILDSYRSSLGIDASIVNIVLAKKCIKISEQNLGENEYINFDEFSYDELCSIVKENYINGCGNKLAFYELVNKYSNKYAYKK